MEDVTLFECFLANGDNVSLLAPALSVRIIKPYRAVRQRSTKA